MTTHLAPLPGANGVFSCCGRSIVDDVEEVRFDYLTIEPSDCDCRILPADHPRPLDFTQMITLLEALRGEGAGAS